MLCQRMRRCRAYTRIKQVSIPWRVEDGKVGLTKSKIEHDSMISQKGDAEEQVQAKVDGSHNLR